jgi:hypothetical protein
MYSYSRTCYGLMHDSFAYETIAIHDGSFMMVSDIFNSVSRHYFRLYGILFKIKEFRGMKPCQHVFKVKEIV